MKKTYQLAMSFSLGAMLIFGVSCAKKKVATAPAAPAPQVVAEKQAAPAPQQRSEIRPAAPEAPPPSRYPDAATRARIEELLARIQDAYFDYDKHILRNDAEKTLQADANELTTILKQYPDYRLTVEGHCDERGSAEYNMGLGEARAKAAKEYLTTLGIPGEQLATVSYGKEKPVCSENTEECYQKNRRAHIVAMAAR